MLGDSVFTEQIENVRITWNPLTADEMSKLWGSFQVAYRLSAAYEVSVVLIRSKKPAAAAPPVLSHRSNAITAWTALESLTILAPGESVDSPLARRPAAELGSSLLLRGTGLRPDASAHLRRPDETELDVVLELVDGQLIVKLSDAPAGWATEAGIYQVFLEIPSEDPTSLPWLL